MSYSPVDICNQALDLVGGSTIIDLDDGSPEANIVSRAYPLVRDRVLRSYEWNVAIMRTSLPELATPPDWGYAHAYELPTAPDYCLRVLEVETDLPWCLEQMRQGDDNGGAIRRIIATDAQPPLAIRYIRRISDVNELDALLIEVMAVELAINIATKLTENTSRVEHLKRHSEGLLKQAKMVDAREGTPMGIKVNSWVLES